MREIVTSAQKATRKARRDADRRQHLKTSARPDKPVPPDTDIADPQADNLPPAKPFDQIEGVVAVDEYPIIDLSTCLPAAGALARLPADERIQRLRADRWIGYPRAVEGAEPAGSPLCVAKQATHAQPAAGWPDQQWQVDDRREVPPAPTRPAPTPTGGAHPGVGRADAVRSRP